MEKLELIMLEKLLQDNIYWNSNKNLKGGKASGLLGGAGRAPGGESRRINPLVPRVQKIKIRKLALTDFYWLNS